MSGIILGWDAEAFRRGMGFVQNKCENKETSGRFGLIEDDSESHVLVVAPTGTGKGRNFIIPNLLHYHGPAIVVDIKGEAAAVTAAYRREQLGQKVVVIDPWGKSGQAASGFNPLDYLAWDAANLTDNAHTLASVLSGGGSLKHNDPYWDERGESLVAGMLVDQATAPDLTDRTMGAVWQRAQSDDLVMDLARRLDTQEVHPFAKAQYQAFLGVSADVTRSCIQSVACSHLRSFGTDAVQEATKQTDFALSDIIDGAPLTIYIVVPPARLTSHAQLLRIMISSLINLILERTSRPEKPTLLMIDEFAQIGPLDAIKQAVTLTRGYGVRCALFVQSYVQLEEMLPKQHKSFLENCGTLCTFGHSKMCMSRGMSEAFGDVSAEVLFQMPKDRLAISVAGGETRFARRLDYLEDPFFAGRFALNPFFSKAGKTPGDGGFQAAA